MIMAVNITPVATNVTSRFCQPTSITNGGSTWPPRVIVPQEGHDSHAEPDADNTVGGELR